jgi:AcrR family transcriptional regulator
MPTKDFSPAENTGRKAAYVARNRLALLKSTQEILAIKGELVTIEDIAEHAQVAVSTIYKHFKDKDELIGATMLWGFKTWEEWALEQVGEIEDPLEQLVLPMRLFVRANESHPDHAQSLANFFGIISKSAPQIQKNLAAHIELLTKIKVLHIENSAAVANNIFAIMAFTLIEQVTNPKAKIADADKAIRSALSMLGISEAKAKKLTESKLVIQSLKK